MVLWVVRDIRKTEKKDASLTLVKEGKYDMKYDLMELKSISKGNIIAWIEAGLRSLSAIDDGLDVVSIKIPYSGFNSEKNHENVGVEIYYKKPIREEDIILKKYGKKG